MQVYRLNVLHVARRKCRTQKIAKNSPSGHHRTTIGLYLRNKGMYRQSEKNLLSSNISSTCPHNMVNFGTLAAEIVSLVWVPLQISTGCESWQRYCTALQYWVSAKLCSVEQRAPPIFGSAVITLGIGPWAALCNRGGHYIFAL